MSKQAVIDELYQQWCDDPEQSITEHLCGKVYDAAIEEAARVADRLTYSPNGASIAAAVRKLKGERNG